MVIAQLGKAIIACCEAHGRATDPFGVRGGAIHSPDEFMIVPSLRERAALSALVLARLSTGDPL